VSENDSVVLGSTRGKNPKAEKYECVVPGCKYSIWSEYAPKCKKHKIQMMTK